MNTPKHTPGPWTQDGIAWINTPDSGGYRCVTISGEDYDITNVMVDEGDETQEANAALIAAAPDLLAALQRIVRGEHPGEDCTLTPECYNIACEAIAKATNTTAP